MKSKEASFEESLDGWLEPTDMPNGVTLSREDLYTVMDNYAKEVVMTYDKWKADNNYTYSIEKEVWFNLKLETFTREELFNKFLTEQ